MSKQVAIGSTESGKLHLDVARLVKTRLLVTANSGGGKSWLLRLLFEQLGQNTQLIVLDREGEFVTLRETLDIVLVGPQGEIPTDVRSAGLLIRRLMEKHLSAVVDMSELPLLQQRRYVKLFLEAFVGLSKDLWRPCFLGLDETHLFCPEKGAGEAESTEAVINLATLGRKRGFCPIFATQRISKFHKDAAAELLNKFIGRTTLDVDQKRAADELGISKDEGRALRELSPPGREGEFYAFGPALLTSGVVRVRVGKVKTTHPEAGQGRTIEPPKPSRAIVAVAKELTDLPQQAEAEVKDLSAAKSRIRELETQLRHARPAAKDQVDPARAARAKKDAATIVRLRKALEEAMKVVAQINARGFEGVGVDAEQVKKAVQAAVDQVVKIVEQSVGRKQQEFTQIKREANQLLARLQKVLADEEVNVQLDVKHNEPFSVTPKALPRMPRDDGGGAGEFGKGAADRMLAALAQEPNGLTDRKLAARAGVSRKKSTYRNAMTDLRKQGFITESNGLKMLTPDGQEAARHVPPRPTGAALLGFYRREIGEGAARQIFEKLVEAGGNAMSKQEIADATGIDLTKSTFRNAMTELRTWDIVDGKADLKLSDEVIEALQE